MVLSQRHRRARRVTLVAAAVLGILFGIKYYFSSKYGNLHDGIEKAVLPFVVYDHEDQPITRHTLFGQVSVILVAPESCPEMCITNLHKALARMQDSLAQVTNENEAGLLQLIVFATESFPNSSGIRFVERSNLSEITAATDVRFSNELATWLIFNQNGNLVLSRESLENTAAEQLMPVLSRLNFNHYLDDYLSKRTFFGPRKSS